MTNAVQTFQTKAPKYMELLMDDFGFSDLDAAAVMGNLGYESEGLTNFQEDSPTKPGSRGGWGWAQWTGPRRRAFEAYAARNDLDPRGDKANYGWLFVELKGSERGAVGKTKAARTLSDKVVAFERAYERAGVKNYPKRIEWAERALSAYRSTRPSLPDPDPDEEEGQLDEFSVGDMVREMLSRDGVTSVLVEYGKKNN